VRNASGNNDKIITSLAEVITLITAMLSKLVIGNTRIWKNQYDIKGVYWDTK